MRHLVRDMASLISEKEIDRPTAPDVRPRSPEVAQDVGVVAAGFFQGVGEDGEAGAIEFARRQGTLVVAGLGEGDHGWSEPGWIDGDGSEGVAENVMEKFPLLPALQILSGVAFCQL